MRRGASSSRVTRGEGYRIPPVAEEIEIIRLLGARTLALALNGEGLSRRELRASRRELERELRIPVALPLEEGVEALIPFILGFLHEETS
jgi:uncharacterized NAD-dependent epimerase/dehydratase family protein